MEKSEKTKEVAVYNREVLATMASFIQSRTELMKKLGMSYGQQRDLYETLGWVKTPEFENYWARYKRTSIGRRLINIYPKSCWKKHPTISEDDKPEMTAFETSLSDFVSEHNVFSILKRLDILSGIGTYGALLLGFSGEFQDQPLSKGEQLLYMRPFTCDSAQIHEYDHDKTSRRYGLPKTYKIRMNSTANSGKKPEDIEKIVHYTRIIHVAEDPDENEYEGTPRLEPVLNDLYGVDLVIGGSGEMFWRGAFPGLAFLAREGYQLPSGTAKDQMEDDITKYIHGLQRNLNLAGMDVHEIKAQLVGPSEHYETILTNILASKGIPKRIFMGSERGELASSQDREQWNDEVSDRQTNFCEPSILRPLIDRMIEVGVIDAPKDGRYIIEWPQLFQTDMKEQALTAKEVAQALTVYASGSAENYMPFPTFATKYLGMTLEEVAEAEKNNRGGFDESEDTNDDIE